MIPVPQGYSFAAVAAGFKKDRNDLAVLVSDRPAVAAGVFTTNKFQAAPVLVARERLEASETARAVVINAGQANACTGQDGLDDCRLACRQLADALGVEEGDILPASTGVIGVRIPMEKWAAAMPLVRDNLGKAEATDFAKAIMTTDAFPKMAAARLTSSQGKECAVFGMAKGAGMICPNMATMLAVVFTDAAVEPGLWRAILRAAVEASFNRVTVDGDTSTNDTVFALANGASGVTIGEEETDALVEAVTQVCQTLAYMLVQDAEGGSKVVRIHVVGANNMQDAETVARTIGHSPLVKTAMYGRDPNWGRIVCALGRSGVEFDPSEVNLTLCGIPIFAKGAPIAQDHKALLAPHMRRQDIVVHLSIGSGPGSYVLLASDLTHEYVTINAEYTT
ncbi:bifunctional glutamate N-acetyltransferase/amino-acid acetyltransferase ArgJ [Megalodesulfovibrio paquesii]